MVKYKNRGKTLESIINYTNRTYDLKGVALINKIPTDWNVSYNRRTKKSEAFPKAKGTVDYIGVYDGVPICFEAKSTQTETRLAFDNFQKHQIDFMKKFQAHGGISFVIVYFETLKETYRLDWNDFMYWYDKAEQGGRKSIPYDYFAESCHLIQSKNGVMLDYLEDVTQ